MNTYHQPANPHNQSPLIVMRVLWGGILFSIVLFILIAFAPAMETDSPFAQPHDLDQQGKLILNIMGIGSCAAIAMGLFLPKIFFARTRGKLKGGLATKSLAELTTLVLAPFLIRISFFEAPAVMGLLAGLITKKPALVFPFAVVAAVLIASQFPTEDRVRGWLEAE